MLILASKSPRRQELLQKMGLTYRVMVSDADETPPENATYLEAACEIALKKALAVRTLCDADDIIIGADTTVVVDKEIFGKPRDVEDARRMLHILSGRDNTVVTGVAVVRGNQVLTRAVETRVRFRKLSEHEIEGYIATGEPMDKAGAYGVQGRASWLVEGIDGDFFNVVGLPLAPLGEMLRAVGFDIWGGTSCTD